MQLQVAGVIVFLSVATLAWGDFSQEDCQPNEVFLQCGQCEGTCANPRPVCEPTCRGRRCECVAKKGFVRSIHGHCVKATECPGPSIYSEDPYRHARPFAKVAGIGNNNAMYHDVERDFKKEPGMPGLQPSSGFRGASKADLLMANMGGLKGHGMHSNGEGMRKRHVRH